MDGTIKSRISLITILIIASLILSACGSNRSNKSSDVSTTEPSSTDIAVTQLGGTIDPTNVPASSPEVPATVVPTATPITDGLTDEQRNSIGMLNYLTMLTQEINTSKNSRLFLESAYSSLVNNTYPNAVDQETEFRLEELLEQLKNYRMNAVKRERLEFIYDRNKAQAIRAAIPNPLGLLSSVQAFNWPQLIASVAYMAVDSVSSYQNAKSQAELQYLQEGWELDDAEYEILHKLRSRAFTYMIEMVNTFSLPGDLALNENAVENYVTWKNEKNVVRRIQLFEANRNIYQGFGPYWLTLADSYYVNGDYQKCIDAIANYESLSTRIFRQDHELAKTLPAAFMSAMEIMDENEFITTAAHYLEVIEANAAFADWSLRYFAAQGNIELYQRTKDESYLSNAYDLVLNNATLLVGNQLDLNASYLADVKKIEILKGTSEEKKKEIELLNKQAEEERKTALIPITEPLLLNCDLLFSISKVLGISSTEQAKIESILHHNNQPLFLVPAIDNRYWFTEKMNLSAAEIEVGFKDGMFTLPVESIADFGTLSLSVKSGDTVTDISDWDILKVERKDKTDITSFAATFSSPTASKFQFKKGDQLLFTLLPTGDEAESKLEFRFTAEERTDWVVHHYLVYVRTEGQ